MAISKELYDIIMKGLSNPENVRTVPGLASPNAPIAEPIGIAKPGPVKTWGGTGSIDPGKGLNPPADIASLVDTSAGESLRLKDAEVFDIVEGGTPWDLFNDKPGKSAYDDLQGFHAEAGKGFQELSRFVATEGLTPLPGEFIPSKAGLSVDDKAFNTMQKELSEVSPFAGDMPSAGPTREDVQQRHGIYEGRDKTYTTEEDLYSETLQRHQAIKAGTLKREQDAQNLGTTDMEIYKESFKKNFAKEGTDVNTLGLNDEDWEKMKDWDDRYQDFIQRNIKLDNEWGDKRLVRGTKAHLISQDQKEEFRLLQKELQDSEWGAKLPLVKKVMQED